MPTPTLSGGLSQARARNGLVRIGGAAVLAVAAPVEVVVPIARVNLAQVALVVLVAVPLQEVWNIQAVVALVVDVVTVGVDAFLQITQDADARVRPVLRRAVLLARRNAPSLVEAARTGRNRADN